MDQFIKEFLFQAAFTGGLFAYTAAIALLFGLVRSLINDADKKSRWRTSRKITMAIVRDRCRRDWVEELGFCIYTPSFTNQTHKE